MDRPGAAAPQMMIADHTAPPLNYSDPLVQFTGTTQLTGDEVASTDAADLERSGEDRFDPFQPVNMRDCVIVGNSHHFAQNVVEARRHRMDHAGLVHHHYIGCALL